MTAEYQIDLNRTASDPISEGVHPFTVISFEEGCKDEPGAHPYIVLTCGCNSPTEEGKTARLFLSLSPAARWKLEDFLNAINAPEEGSVTADKFLKRKFRAKVVHRDYEGRTQANLETLFRLTDKAPAPAPKATVKKATSSPKKTTAPSKGVDESGEDIPF